MLVPPQATAKAARSPTLETIRMVENFIKEHSGEYRRKALWRALPRRMMYQTYRQTIEYLLESAKIDIDAGGLVIWIYAPELFRRYEGREDLRIA
jgi:hypothetical protein